METLKGHVSPETAYIVNDYPYGYTLRCKIRYWIESDEKRGMRFCSQTTNPKVSGEKWNAPKKSTYSDLRVMYLDEKNHVHTRAVSFAYDAEETILKLIEEFADVLSEYKHGTALMMRGKLIALTRRNMHLLTEGKNIFEFPKEEQAKIIGRARLDAVKQVFGGTDDDTRREATATRCNCKA